MVTVVGGARSVDGVRRLSVRGRRAHLPPSLADRWVGLVAPRNRVGNGAGQWHDDGCVHLAPRWVAAKVPYTFEHLALFLEPLDHGPVIDTVHALAKGHLHLTPTAPVWSIHRTQAPCSLDRPLAGWRLLDAHERACSASHASTRGRSDKASTAADVIGCAHSWVAMDSALHVASVHETTRRPAEVNALTYDEWRCM